MFIIPGASILSSIYMHIADKKNRWTYIILAILILLVPSTFRDISIGTDVSVYQLPMFSIATRSHGLMKYILNTNYIVSDYGYSAITYFVAKLFGDIHFLFLVEGLIIIIPIYYVIWNYRDRVDVGITVLAYNFLFYVETYNVVRQYMAISLLVLAFYFCEKNKKIGMSVCMIIAFLFHNSAILFVLAILLYKILEIQNKKYVIFFVLLIFIFSVCFSTFYVKILTELGKFLNFLPKRYFSIQYLQNDEFNIRWSNLLFAIVNLIILLRVRTIAEKKQWIDFLVLASLLSIGTTYFTASASWSFRIIWYFTVFQIFGFGIGCKLFKKNKFNYLVYYLMLLIIFATNWIYYYVIRGNAGIIPYKFM